MVLIGRRLSVDEWRQVLADPATVDTLLYGDLDNDQAEMPDSELDLDKSWHAIHYLITGTAWDIDEGTGAAILGGDKVGEDNGYGRARLLSPENVRTIATSLDALHVDALRARFDPSAMAAADITPPSGTARTRCSTPTSRRTLFSFGPSMAKPRSIVKLYCSP